MVEDQPFQWDAVTPPEGFTHYQFVAVNQHNRLIFSTDGKHWVNFDGTNA